jgi:hypothetical protein
LTDKTFIMPLTIQSPVAKSKFLYSGESAFQFAIQIFAQTNKDTVLSELARICSLQLGFGDCLIMWVDRKANYLIPCAAQGRKYADIKHLNDSLSVCLGKGIKGSVVKSGKAEIVSDASIDDRYLIDDRPRYSELVVPIMVNNRVVGIIDCEHEEKNFFHDDHADALKSLADMCALRIVQINECESLLEQQNRIWEMDKNKKEIQNKAFRVQFSPHFVFNALNVIQHFITINDKKRALGGLNKFSLLLRHYMDFYGYDKISVREEINMLKVYLQLQELRYEGKLKIFIENYCTPKALDQSIPSLLIASVMEDILERLMQRGESLVKIWISFNDRANAFQLQMNSTVVPAEKTVNPLAANILDYRLDIPTWKEQIEQLNQTEMFNIQYQEKNVDATMTQPYDVKYIMELSVPHIHCPKQADA